MRYLLFLLASWVLLLPGHSQAQALLRNGDVFELTLGGMPAEYAAEYHLSLTIGEDNEVKLPYIGSLKAGGLSTTQLARAIERKLVADKIFTNPTAVINMQPASRFVMVGGAVRAPQAVPWTADMTLSMAIVRAGDFSDFADKKKVKVTRQGKVTYYNLTKTDKDPTQNPKLDSQDEIYVKE